MRNIEEYPWEKWKKEERRKRKYLGERLGKKMTREEGKGSERWGEKRGEERAGQGRERKEKSKRNRIFRVILLVTLSRGCHWYPHRNYHNSLLLSFI